ERTSPHRNPTRRFGHEDGPGEPSAPFRFCLPNRRSGSGTKGTPAVAPLHHAGLRFIPPAVPPAAVETGLSFRRGVPLPPRGADGEAVVDGDGRDEAPFGGTISGK